MGRKGGQEEKERQKKEDQALLEAGIACPLRPHMINGETGLRWLVLLWRVLTDNCEAGLKMCRHTIYFGLFDKGQCTLIKTFL